MMAKPAVKSSLLFTARIVDGGTRYRATEKLKSLFPLVFNNSNDKPDTETESATSKLRLHPFQLSLPAISLPHKLDSSAIDFLRTNSPSSPKALEDRARLLLGYLWSRQLVTEDHICKSSSKSQVKVAGSDEVDECAGALQYHHIDKLALDSGRQSRVSRDINLSSWKSLSYSGHNCELYLVARLAPNFASTCRVLYEIRKRCPNFIPRSLFDFGSGLGTTSWAVNTVWPVGCVREHTMFEPSAHMTRLSEFMLLKNDTTAPQETVFPGIYHRRFMSASKQKHDLVVSAHSLLELPGTNARARVIASLWDRTSDFLVLIEQGTKAGFQAILEARKWLIQHGGEEVCLFSPCPHNKICGKQHSVCNIAVRYYKLGLTRIPEEPAIELISYLVVSRGDWRRHQVPAVEPDSDFLPRIVSYKLHNSKVLIHDLCLPSGEVERTAFPKSKTDKALHFFLRHSQAGDIMPAELTNVVGNDASFNEETDE